MAAKPLATRFLPSWHRPIPAGLSLAFGQAGQGQPLPDDTRRRLEAIFAADLSALRAHVGWLPALLGARALAHGTDLYFAPDVYAPGTPAGDAVIAHEIVHVFQQQARRASRSSARPALVHDAAQEALAEQVALLVRHNDPAARDLVRRAFGERPAPRPDTVRWDVLQPNVHVEIDGRDIKLTDVNAAMKQIQNGIRDHEIAWAFGRLKTRIRPILEEWIKASRRLVKRYIAGRKEQTVRYGSWDSLARALIGEVRSAGSKETERRLAEETVQSAWVNDKLEEYLTHIRNCLDRQQFAAAKKEIFPKIGWYSKEYSHWYPKGGIAKILNEPGKCELKHKVAGIHDVVSAFKKVDSDYADVPPEKCVATALVPNGVRGYRTVKSPMEDEDYNLLFRVGSLRDKDCTLVEENEIIRSYRDVGVPVGFGPSFTTGRTLNCCHKLCQDSGVVGSELGWINACAWGLFAFWNLYYERRYSRCHTFHEAMDMANNYGVPYNPFCYPLSPPTYAEPYPLGDQIY